MCKPCYYTIQFPVPRGGKMVRFRRKAMGNRDTCVPGGGTPPLREDGRLGGFAVGVVRIGEVLLRQSLRLPIRADTSLYTREAFAGDR